MNKPKVRISLAPARLKEYPVGPTFQAGHLVEDNAGWRTFKPVLTGKCVKCLQCFLLCPEGCIGKTETGIEIDYNFCKGCGICAKVCNPNAISMVKEG